MRRIASMAQGYQICHCEERSDVAISQNPTGQQGSHRRNRNCLPEIATAPSGPRNDKSGAITVLSSTCASCQRAAGSGMPLPYNGGCDQRNCLPEIAPQGHFLALRAQGATAPSGPRNDKAGCFPHSSFFSLQDSFISVPLPCNTRLTALQNFPLSIFDFPRSPMLLFSVFLYKYFRIESAKIRKKINKVRKYP